MTASFRDLSKDGRGSSPCGVDDIELDLHVRRAPVLLVNPAPLPLDLDTPLLDDASMRLWKLFCAERVRTGHLTLLRNEQEALVKRGSRSGVSAVRIPKASVLRFNPRWLYSFEQAEESVAHEGPVYV